jgi:hypothetical protein
MKNALRSLILGLFALALVGSGSCGSNNSSDSAYKDSLTFGTGLGGTGFDLLNEGTTFSVAALGSQSIYFKLGSAADMAGRAVRLYINDGTYATKDYTNPQSYGHYLLSAFRITDVGAFTVKAYLVAQVGPDIGKETFVAQSTITMQP